ncbi:hypothetical protein CW677_12010, partial [Macrococcoides caseolyticum]
VLVGDRFHQAQRRWITLDHAGAAGIKCTRGGARLLSAHARACRPAAGALAAWGGVASRST